MVRLPCSMRMLYVTEDVPDRSPEHGNGTSMIPYEVIRNLPAGVVIDLVTWDYGKPMPDVISARCDEVIVLKPHTGSMSRSILKLLPFSQGAIERLTNQVRRLVKAKAYDVTVFHGPHFIPLALTTPGPLVLQLVDPWSLRLEMESRRLAGLKKAWRRIQVRQASVLERLVPKRAVVATVGELDARILSSRTGREVVSVSNGVDSDRSVRSLPDGLSICFVGSLDYVPNIEAAEVLVREVAPELRRRCPDARIVIAGRHPVPEVLALSGPGVEVRPNVPSVADVYAECHVAVFPDLRGSGVRNSITEALVNGIPVVATPVAAREQPPTPLLRVAETPSEIVDGVMEMWREAPEPSTEPMRSWVAVADDYVELCRKAIASAR